MHAPFANYRKSSKLRVSVKKYLKMRLIVLKSLISQMGME